MVKVKFEGFGNDCEVTAKTGDILLRVAKDNGVNIPTECGDGECGSCACEVKILSANAPTERLDSQGKELKTLIGRGITTVQEAQRLEMMDQTPPVRLACQCIVRSDILVKPYI